MYKVNTAVVIRSTVLALLGFLAASSCYAEETKTISDVRLVIIFRLPDDSLDVQVRKAGSVTECKAMEEWTHDVSLISSDVLDVATICVQSEFDLAVKRKV